MKYIYLLTILQFGSLQLIGQMMAYPPDSLTTIASIPRGAVKIPDGLPSGPDARLQHAIYKNIRFPRTALVSKTGGKVVVFGIVDTAGIFQIDSAGLYREQSAIVIDDTKAKLKTEGISLGVVKNFVMKKKKWLLADAPKKWSQAQRDLVLEAIRIARELPKFKPATINGKNVPASVNLPVNFRHKGNRF